MEFVTLLTLLLVNRCVGYGFFVEPGEISRALMEEIAVEMLKCARKMGNGSDLVRQALNYWNRDFQFEMMDPFVGCLATCALFQLHWLDEKEHFIEQNLKTFFSATRADRNTTETQFNVMQRCYNPPNGIEESCVPGFEYLICYRKAMFDLYWNPVPIKI